MKDRRFTRKQIAELLLHPDVEACTQATISFTPSFKIHVVQEYLQGMSAQEIFIMRGFSIQTLGKENPSRSVLRWHRIYREQGVLGLLENQKGRPKKCTNTEVLEIETLRTHLAYTIAENLFLKELRSRRAE
jgi:transposase